MIELKKKTKVRKLNLDIHKRIIFVSDIHGDISSFKDGLNKVGFSKDDYLFIIGDIIEKGELGKNIETLRYVMELSKMPNVYPMSGNCDEVFRFILPEDQNQKLLKYINEKKRSILTDIAIENNFPISYDMDVNKFKEMIMDKYKEFYDFIDSLDDLIIINNEIVLVHGGIDDINNIPEYAISLLKYDNYYELAKPQKYITIVGHYPTRNYRKDISNCNPIFDFRKKIISIDGGNHIVKGGQLNFVILESLASMSFRFTYTDHYEKYIMKKDAIYDKPSTLINLTYQDNEIEILDTDLDYYFVRHIRTNTEMWVHSSFVYKDETNNKYYSYDATNQFLSVRSGDTISIIKRGLPYSVIKHDGNIGLIDTKYITDDIQI